MVPATLLALALVAGTAQARPVPDLSRRVTDQAGALSSTTVERLEQRLAAYEQQTGHQLAVLVIPSLQGDVLESYSLQVAEAWRLGDQKRSDGALLLVSTGDRALRIEVGYGLEGAIPDHQAARVIDQHIIPRFKQGDVDGGVEAGVEALMKLASGENLGPAPQAAPTFLVDNKQALSGLAFVWFFFLRMPRLIRAVLMGAAGGVVGWFVLASALWGVGLSVAGALLGLVLPKFRGGGGRGWSSGSRGGRSSSSSTWSSGSSRSSSSSGGFRGGGGSFGGGGASGRW